MPSPRGPLVLAAALAVLLAATVLAGCVGLGGGTAIDGSDWRIVAIDGQAPLAGTQPALHFADGQVGGATGCNSFGGAYAIAGGRLSIEHMSITAMGCDQQVGSQEAAILKAVSDGAGISVAADSLSITGGGVHLEAARAP
jgi:heat shock protein HslJ